MHRTTALDVSGDINLSGRLRIPNQVAFRAVVGSTLIGTSSTPLVFSSVSLNVGTNYNSSNGRFTTPYAGLYYFSSAILIGATVSSSTYIGVIISVNGTTVTETSQQHVIGNWSSRQILTIVYLNAGDYDTAGSYSTATNTPYDPLSCFNGYYIG